MAKAKRVGKKSTHFIIEVREGNLLVREGARVGLDHVSHKKPGLARSGASRVSLSAGVLIAAGVATLA